MHVWQTNRHHISHINSYAIIIGVLTTGQKLASEIGAGNGVSTPPKTTPKDATSSQSRGRRQADGTHCYEPQDALSLNPQQCNGNFTYYLLHAT